MSHYVVVLAGKSARKVGRISGRDRHELTKSLVHFPGETFPHDFRSIWSDNLRAATDAERERALI